MTAHKFNLGVRPDRSGPQFAIEAALYASGEIEFDCVGKLGAFWPLEWRLVVEWSAALERLANAGSWGLLPHSGGAGLEAIAAAEDSIEMLAEMAAGDDI
jgi:hypothetical protein